MGCPLILPAVAAVLTLEELQRSLDNHDADCSRTPVDAAPGPLHEVDDQQNYEPQYDDADKSALPPSPPRRKGGTELTPIPLVGIIRVGRHRTYRRGHQPSEGSRNSIRGLVRVGSQSAVSPANDVSIPYPPYRPRYGCSVEDVPQRNPDDVAWGIASHEEPRWPALFAILAAIALQVI